MFMLKPTPHTTKTPIRRHAKDAAVRQHIQVLSRVLLFVALHMLRPRHIRRVFLPPSDRLQNPACSVRCWWSVLWITAGVGFVLVVHRIDLVFRCGYCTHINGQQSAECKKRHHHSKRVPKAAAVRDWTQDGRYDCTARRSCGEYKRSKFRSPAKAPDAHGEDERKDARLEKEDQNDHGHTCISFETHRKSRGNDDASKQEKQYPSWFDKRSSESRDEPPDSKASVAYSLVIERTDV